jgi:hypothetical protein
MNNKTNLAIAFLLAGTLLTSVTAMAPVFAEDDDDDHDKYDKDGDGNKQKVEDDSAGAIADCDENEVERADFDCIASAASGESTVGDGEDGLFPVDGECRGNRIPVTIDGLTLCIPPGFLPR